MDELGKLMGVKPEALDQQQQLNNIMKGRLEIIDEINRKEVKATSPLLAAAMFAGGIFTGSSPLGKEGTAAPSEDQKKQLESFLKQADKTAAELKSKIAGTFIDPAKLKAEAEMIAGLNLLIFENTRARQLNASAAGEQADIARQMIEQGAASTAFLNEFDTTINLVNADTATLSDTMRGAAEAFGKPPTLTAWQQFLSGVHQTFTKASAQIEAFQIGAQAAASAVSSALAGESVSGTKAIHDLLKQMSSMLLMYSLMFLAMGIAGSSGNVAALAMFGDPHANFVAAGQFAAAGVAAGLASRAFGGGGEGGSSGGGGRGGGGRNRGGDTSNQTINVVVQGSVDDPNAFARKIAFLINTNRADGARA
jgi:hypothetical protein